MRSPDATVESPGSEKIPPTGETRSMAELLHLSDTERRVLSAIREDPTCIDQIVQDTGLPSSEVLATISLLEVRRLIRRLGGNWVCLR
jgi:DNA processing protein